jgi:cobalamin biosynthesis protein CobT
MDEFAKSIKELCRKEKVGSDYTIYTTDNDRVIPFKTKGIDGLADFEQKVSGVSGVLKYTLERLIKAKSVSRRIGGRKSGSINSAALYRLKTEDFRVFRQKEESITNDVDVSLVVDCSGSMRHQDKVNGEYISRITVAMQSAYAMCDVLTKLNINCEVIGFTTNASFATRESESPTYGFSRYEPLYMPIFKEFGERFSIEQKQRIYEIQSNIIGRGILRNNVDGECIRIAAKRLIFLGKSKKKTMIVFSDGRPEAYGSGADQHRDLLKAVKEITASGINLIGIGIGDNAVRNYYPKCSVVNNIGELPNVLLKVLSDTLLK